MKKTAKFTEATFNAILASSVHDMKNSLGLLLNTIEEMASTVSAEDETRYQQFSYLQYQASRLNNDLITLLSLYKIDHDQYPFNLNEITVADFLEEQTLRYVSLLSRKQMQFEVDCDESLWWYFDEGLLSGVVNDVVGNSIRYAKETIRLSAREVDGYLQIDIEDDGDGYPEQILSQDADAKKGVNHQTGSTGLGLFFTTVVANMHENNGRSGYVKLDNDSRLGGGRFSIFLP